MITDHFESRLARRHQLAKDLQHLIRRPDFRKPWMQAKELLDLQLRYLGLVWNEGDIGIACQVSRKGRVYYVDMRRRDEMEVRLVVELRYAHVRHDDFPLWIRALREQALLRMPVAMEEEAVRRFALYDRIMDNIGPVRGRGMDYKNLRNPMDFLAIQPYGYDLPEEFRNVAA